jgi:phosphoribosylaminoimidazole (AIR) synthetase
LNIIFNFAWKKSLSTVKNLIDNEKIYLQGMQHITGNKLRAVLNWCEKRKLNKRIKDKSKKSMIILKDT